MLSPSLTSCVIDMAELASLEADITARWGQPGADVRPLPSDLEARRVSLLKKYLGGTPILPTPILYVVGDSHSVFFGGAERIIFNKGRRVWTGFFRARYISAVTELLPVFRVFHVGPATAWQADERGSSTRAREKIDALLRSGDIPVGAGILLVFGEIDCRCHIPKAVLGGSTIEMAVNATVERFMRLPRRLKAAGYTPAVWLTTLMPICGDVGNPDDSHALPIIGPQALRDEISLIYCSKLAEACHHVSIRSVGVPRPPDNIRSTCFLDGHHLSQRMMPEVLSTLVKANILPLAFAPTPRPT